MCTSFTTGHAPNVRLSSESQSQIVKMLSHSYAPRPTILAAVLYAQRCCVSKCVGLAIFSSPKNYSQHLGTGVY